MNAHGGSVPYVGVLLEQTLGHVTHGRNLRYTFQQASAADVVYRDLSFDSSSLLDRLPPRSNWTVRSGLAARSAVRAMETERNLDALLVHTHVPATFLSATMKRVPTVVSIDATPGQIDSLGGSYNHKVHAGFVETAKQRYHRRCFQEATRLVTWSKWAADSLVVDYGVDRAAIEVIPPGVITSQWLRTTPRLADDETVRILFVGGDFERKGGRLLMEAVERLRRDPEVIQGGFTIELHLVTGASVPPRPGVHVHNGMVPNSPELIDLFHRCDIFALPTLGDCTPLVLAEAATAGLPTVSTNVGAIGESVLDGLTGHLVEPSVESVVNGLRPLVFDPQHRLTLGSNAAIHAARTMDSHKNALRLLDQVVGVSERTVRVPRVLLTVSGNVAPEVHDAIDAGLRPLADYVAISRATNAELLDWEHLRGEASATTNMVRRLAGHSVAIAHHIWRRQEEYDVVITDGEQVGLPLAVLTRFGRSRQARHIMIAHRLSPLKKSLLVRLLGLANGVDEVLVYSTSQRLVAERLFKGSDVRVRQIDFMVDTEFFRPTRQPSFGTNGRRPLLCTAGREFRDYPTLIEAVRGLDVDLVVASASPWSKRPDNSQDVTIPDNVTVTALTQRGLRDLLDEADAVIMPLEPSDFQAGITTILEAMSMERPIICTATDGQTDVVEDGVHGLYVAPGDMPAMRRAIQRLIDDPVSAVLMGKKGRELAQKQADVRLYADLFAESVRFHVGGQSRTAAGRKAVNYGHLPGQLTRGSFRPGRVESPRVPKDPFHVGVRDRA